jgi:catechol 2,3-dioxygenase-like lactoylglutathione lyase family enzyme
MSTKSLVITALLLSASLGAAELTLDHVSVAGRDLKQMQARLAALGIPSEFGGPHSNHATQMALTSFPDGSYLELIALQDKPDAKAVAAHYWSRQIRGNAGPAAWAVRAADTEAEVKRLRAAGIEVTLQRSGRERPDGTRLEWEAAPVGPGPNGVFFPFLIHDFTPREARAFPKGHPATRDFSGIKRVVIAVRDLKASIARYRQAYALPEPLTQEDASFGARLASFRGTPAVLAEPLDPQSWVARRILQFGDGPCAFVLGKPEDGAPRRAAYQTAAKSRWFGVAISWFDSQRLGWHLGFED